MHHVALVLKMNLKRQDICQWDVLGTGGLKFYEKIWVTAKKKGEREMTRHILLQSRCGQHLTTYQLLASVFYYEDKKIWGGHFYISTSPIFINVILLVAKMQCQ